MKKLTAATFALFALALHAIAVPLTPGTLADYLALGPGGGTIGSTTFSNFSLLPNQGGATAISPASISVTPLNIAGSPTLQFDFLQTALTGQLLEMRIAYAVSAFSITGAGVGLLNAVTTGDAAVTAVLSVTGPTLQPPDLIALETLGFSIPTDQTVFPSIASLTVESNVVLDGGLAGQSGLGRVTNQFTVAGAPPTSVPDSGVTLALLTMGLCGIGVVRRLLVA